MKAVTLLCQKLKVYKFHDFFFILKTLVVTYYIHASTRLSMALNIFLDIIVIVTVDFTLSDPQSLWVDPVSHLYSSWSINFNMNWASVSIICHRVRILCTQIGARTRDASPTGRVLYWLNNLSAWHIISPMVTKSVV